ncbi:hypothetical protein K227x_48390 [Rubripirellula lacrimiformis]|uniref:Nickel uptake substrate-specific transmembrane region n=1 Tax=Rubripirellula lacrimiformis TaxID=1930273 RepID=A0A517NH19_9BACT|nr:Ig-like domain-containing protein [Rubripirellula lacrimiformis]QDT06429.1 hypothetical protein K227x_48390 [Rubripirellula lacrimiformis]
MLRFALPLVGFVLVATSLADDAAEDAVLAKLGGGQLAKTFQVQVSDPDGNPIDGVTVTPWALRSSQGHGRWSGGDDLAEMPPQPVTTGPDGIATIRYPFYRDVNERTRTFSVSAILSHPDFTIDDSVHIDVPLLDDGPHKIEMSHAASISLIPLSSSPDFHIDQVYVVSSDRISSRNELPIILGRRDRRVTAVTGETLTLTLQLEPTGIETLGEYDKLAGIVFGCSTREGKQICALPEVREKMDAFARRLREADNPRDPAVLAEAFAVVAEAFDRADDLGEAAKWRVKADAEKAKLQHPTETTQSR